MRIRDALADDLPAIVRIYNASVPGRESTADLEPVTVRQRGAWFVAHTPDRRPLWVAEEEPGAALGWCSLRDFYGRPAYAATAEIGIYVDAGARRRGVGRTLLRTAIERGPGLGLSTLIAVVFSHNAASVGLFEGMGFEPWGLLPGVARLDERLADVQILGRPLPE
jgi:L-amino acid N-acyltransferase YncA